MKPSAMLRLTRPTEAQSPWSRPSAVSAARGSLFGLVERKSTDWIGQKSRRKAPLNLGQLACRTVNPLDSCNAKLRQAEGHTKALHEEIRAFHKRGVIRIGREPDPESSDYVFFVEASEEPPILEWGCRVGDVIHNLASALDHLTWQLVIACKGEQVAEDNARVIYFPVALSRDDFNSLPVIEMIDPVHVATLGGCQPYHRGDRKRAEGHPLATLKHLSRIDKHSLSAT